jgi:16S rRNA (cytosine967-C5)-methyltransferase
LALRVLHAVDAEGAYANLALDRALEVSRLPAADRALATELVYGVTRWRGRLDHVIDHLSTTPAAELPPWIRNILRMGVYQLLHLDRIPARAVVSEGVALAREFGHRGTAALANAVLRRAVAEAGRVPLPGPEEGDARRLAVEGSHPEWLVARWLGQFGSEETERLCRVDNEPAPLTLRVNLWRTTPAEAAAALACEGVRTVPGRLFPEALVARAGPPLRELEAYRCGMVSAQDEGAMVASRVLAPEPGWLVVDACAGAGGKTTHLAELMRNRGRVVAVDPYRHKVRLLEGAARRLGLGIIETRCADARTLPTSELAGRADAVLVDAPCSGLGVLRRRPDLRWRLKEEDLPRLVRLQKEILRAASSCVRPGGVLVYSTCTIERSENQEVVEGFLAESHEFTMDNAARRLAGAGVGTRGLTALSEGPYLTSGPQSGGPDGFFVARLVRTGGSGRLRAADV